MLWSMMRLIFKTSSVTPDIFYVFNLILSISTRSESFEKICTWELLGANVLKSCIFKKLNFSWTSPYFRVSCPFNEPCLELCSRKIFLFSEQIMSADKYPTIFSCQMEAIFYLVNSQLRLLHF